jgi:hypothetical protein
LEIQWRTAMIRASLSLRGGNFRGSAGYQKLDSSEKGALSFFLGQAQAKLFAHDIFRVSHFVHYDNYGPKIYGLAGREDSFAFEISGRLHWTGRHVPNLSEVVCRVYPSPEYWMLRDEDRYLLDQFGLRYTLHISLVAPKQGVRVDDDRSILIPDQGKARVVQSILDLLDCGWNRYLTFDDFVDAHRGQIQALINDYRGVIDVHHAS